MTKTETQKIQQFIGSIADKDYSKASNALEAIVSEKLKTQIRKSVQENKK
jgi:hypothetical protein